MEVQLLGLHFPKKKTSLPLHKLTSPEVFKAFTGSIHTDPHVRYDSGILEDTYDSDVEKGTDHTTDIFLWMNSWRRKIPSLIASKGIAILWWKTLWMMMKLTQVYLDCLLPPHQPINPTGNRTWLAVNASVGLFAIPRLSVGKPHIYIFSRWFKLTFSWTSPNLNSPSPSLDHQQPVEQWKKPNGWLFDIGDDTIQLYGDYIKPL